MVVLSKFETVPKEILEELVLDVIEPHFLGPPTALSILLRLSRTIYNDLNRMGNPRLYAHLCSRMFDVRAGVRRLGASVTDAVVLTDELVRRCEGLKRLKNNAYPRGVAGDTLDEGLRIDMWMAYLMFKESEGKNAQQLLQYARIDRFALEFVKPGGRLHDGAGENEGWTVDSEVNALGIWLFWFTDHERTRIETAAEREAILGALGCFYAGSFKYACTHAPLTSFLIPPVRPPPPSPSGSIFPLSASPTFPACVIPDHFGFELTFARPLATQPALFASLVRLGGCDGGTPPGSRAPATRVEAVGMGWSGATGEDYMAFRRQETQTVEWYEVASEQFDHDWTRQLICWDPWSFPAMRDRVFTPGMLDGVWEGRWLAIPPNYFDDLLQTAQAHHHIATPLQPSVIQQPMQFRLREHHQKNRDDMVEFDDISCDGVGQGALRAWLPIGTQMVEEQGRLRVYDPTMKEPSVYRTYDPVKAALDEELLRHTGLYSGGVWDIILTAETDDGFSEAWGYDRYVGRVRDWDGLVVLVREVRPNAGRWVFSGYVYGNQNLVGRWRETGTHVDWPGWEGVWTMIKRPA